MSKRSQYLFLLFIAYAWFQNFSKAILPTHYLSEGLTLSNQMMGSLMGFLGEGLLILVLGKYSSKLAMRLGIIAWVVNLMLVMTIKSDLQFYIASAIGGCSTYLFLVIYYIAHFNNTKQENRGISSSLLFVIPTLIGFIAPLIAGYLSQVNNIWVWIVSTLSFAIAFWLVKFQDDFKMEVSFKKSLSELKKTRVLLFIEGVWETLMFGIIPIYTLFFIKTPLGYGIFLSYISLVSVLANFALGKLTDKLKKRSVFLYPVTIILAITTIMFVFVTHDIKLWIIAVSVIQFFVPLFWSLATALVVDAHPNLKVAMPGRELLLGSGRMFGLLLAYLSFIYEKTPQVIFILLGLTMFCFPTVLYWNSKVRKIHNYF